MSKPRIAFISPSLAVRDYHGGCAYAAALLEELHHAGCDIVHVWLADLRGRRPFRLPVLPGGGKVRIPGALCLARLVVPLPFSRISHSTFVRRLVASSDRPDLAILDRAPTAALWENKAGCPAWVLTIDSLHRRAALYESHGYAKDFDKADASEEMDLLARADGIIAIQEDEARLFRDMLPGMPVITVPHPVRCAPLPPGQTVPGTLLFIGGSAAHNVDGIQWFVREVFPLVLREAPGTILEIAGAVCDSVSDHPSLRKLGHVSDLTVLYGRAEICLAPLRFGTGLKIKVMEAMGFGRPVIGTPVAAEGFEDLPAALAGVEQGAEAMAQVIVNLLKDERLKTQAVERQMEWLKLHITPEVAVRPLLEQLGNSSAGTRRGGLLSATIAERLPVLMLCFLTAFLAFAGGVVFQKRVTIGFAVKTVRSWLNLDQEPAIEYRPQGDFYQPEEIEWERPSGKLHDAEAARRRREGEIFRLQALQAAQQAHWASAEVQRLLSEIHAAAEARTPSKIQMRLQRYYPPHLPGGLLQPLSKSSASAVVDAVCGFASHLEAQGRHLIFVPLPNPVDIDLPLFLEQRHYTSVAAADTALFLELLKRGIDVIDLREPFAYANLNGRGPFYRADHHWTAEGMEIAARAISERFGKRENSRVGDPIRMTRQPIWIPEVDCNRDFAPRGMRFGDSLAHQVQWKGKALRQSLESPVLVLGDSNVALHVEGQSDFTSQLAFEMGRPLACYGQMGGTQHVPRLYDDMIQRTGMAPEVVIWVAINGGWRELRPSAIRADRTSESPMAGPLRGRFEVVATSEPPRPGDAPYPDALYAFKVRSLESGQEAVVITWAFRERQEVASRRVQAGEKIALDLVPWEQACAGQTDLRRLQRVDTLDEFMLPEFYWPASK